MRKTISVVSPCYNEEETVRTCYEEVRRLFSEDETLSKYNYEHIFADNYSDDRTLDILKELAAADPNVRVIANARNYGPFRSTFNALRRASGDAVIPMLPVDLQDPPALISEFVRKWEQGYLRAYGVRMEREESAIMQAVRRMYYSAVNKFSNINIPENMAEFQLIDRKILSALLRFRDHYPYIRGMIANVGFAKESIAVPYTWGRRSAGMSKNRLFNLIDQALNGLISFTNIPMRAAIFIGFSMSTLSIVYAIVQFCITILVDSGADPGIPTIIVAIFFLSGVQLAMLGVMGEYISSIHSQVRHGDIVIEKEIIGWNV